MKVHWLSWEIFITTIRTMWGLFSSGDRPLHSMEKNPQVSWEKKQFHIDNVATTELHLAFADKSVPVTKEFSTPRAICAIHWTSESQQAPRHTRGIFVITAEGKGSSGGAAWCAGGVRVDVRHEGQRSSYTQRHFLKSGMPAVTTRIPENGLCASLKGGVSTAADGAVFNSGKNGPGHRSLFGLVSLNRFPNAMALCCYMHNLTFNSYAAAIL